MRSRKRGPDAVDRVRAELAKRVKVFTREEIEAYEAELRRRGDGPAGKQSGDEHPGDGYWPRRRGRARAPGKGR